MGNTIYAYSSQDVGNIRNTPSGVSPSEIKVDPSSNSTMLISTFIHDGTTIKFIAEGAFIYNSIKQSYADVVSSTVKKVYQYDNGILTKLEINDDGYDGFKSIYGSVREMLDQYRGNDFFYGSVSIGRDDEVRGYIGNDSFTGYGSGKYGDYFDGEAGLDKAYFRGMSYEYSINSSQIYDRIKDNGEKISGFTVTDNILSRDGIDYYANVERLYFLDKVVALDIDGNAGQAYRLYKAALNRTPDERGLAGWVKFMDDGGALVNMAQQFIDSTEFKTKYGALDNTAFINQLYQNVLNRNGEPTGVAGWVGGLNNGLSRADVLKGFSESSENQANVIGQIKNGIAYTEWWLT